MSLLRDLSLLLAALLTTAGVYYYFFHIPAKIEADGFSYLAERRSDPDVFALASGLQYKILASGNGTHHPLTDTPCDCHYEGRLAHDLNTTFDSSYTRGKPSTFRPSQVIKGWREAMQLMVAGDKWELYIPHNLAYGQNGSPPKIPGKSALVFTMELVSVDKGSISDGNAKKATVVCEAPEFTDCTDEEKAYVEKQMAKIQKQSSNSDNSDSEGENLKRNMVKKELHRLKRISKESSKPGTGSPLREKQWKWLNARIRIMGKMAEKEEL